MRRMVTGFGALAVVVALTAGCTAAAKEPVGLTASPTATATSTPTTASTPTPASTTGVVMDLSDPTLGIVFAAVPAVSGDAADVYNWIATYEKESWRTKVTGTLSPGLSVVASAEVTADVQSTLDGNVKSGSHFGGVLHVRVDGISAEGDTAKGTACRDFAEVTFSNADGPDTPEQAGYGLPRLMELTLARVPAENRWKILTIKENGPC